MAATAVAIMPKVLANMRFDKIYDGKKLNVALVGLGRYAGILADGLQASQYCRLAGVVTGHPAKAAAWKAKYNLPEKNIYNYENFDAVADNPDIDLIYVWCCPTPFIKRIYGSRGQGAQACRSAKSPWLFLPGSAGEMIDAQVQQSLAFNWRSVTVCGGRHEPYNLEIEKRLGQQKVFGSVRYVEAGLGYKTSNFESGDAGKSFDINDPSVGTGACRRGAFEQTLGRRGAHS